MGTTTGKVRGTSGSKYKSLYSQETSSVAFGYVGQFQRNYYGDWPLNILKSPIIYLIIAYFPRRYEIYGIGYNKCGELGLGHSEPLLKYERLYEVENLLDHPSNIFCGYARFMIKTIEGKLYCCGNNYRGDCGVSMTDLQNIETFTQTNVTNNVEIVGDGTISNHTIIMRQNTFYGFGSNRRQQFGDSYTESNFSPMQISLLQISEAIVKIKCGEYHTLFLTNGGSVYSCGDNQYGQCGQSKSDNKSKQSKYLPITQIKELTNIVDITCGAYHNLVRDNQNKLFVFGDNPNGQLGIPLYSEQTDTTQAQNDENIVFTPVESPYFKRKNIAISKIGAGNVHSCVLDMEGNCFLFGSNEFGQIGTGKDFVDYISKPFCVNTLQKLNSILFDQISIGYQHSVFLSHYNDIYTVGDNEYNQCSSICKEKKISHPWMITRNEIGINENASIDSVIAGSDTTIIITKM